jgi:hypothetical protein
VVAAGDARPAEARAGPRGLTDETTESLEAELASLSAADIAEALTAFLGGSLLISPELGPTPTGWHPYPMWSQDVIDEPRPLLATRGRW